MDSEIIAKEMGIPQGQHGVGNKVRERYSNASFFETLILGDPDKKKAKTEAKQADAEFTKALAQLTQQMAVEQTKRQADTNNTTFFVVGGILFVGAIITAAYFINKHNKSMAMSPAV